MFLYGNILKEDSSQGKNSVNPKQEFLNGTWQPKPKVQFKINDNSNHFQNKV